MRAAGDQRTKVRKDHPIRVALRGKGPAQVLSPSPKRRRVPLSPSENEDKEGNSDEEDELSGELREQSSRYIPKPEFLELPC